MEVWQLKQKQSLSLEAKVLMTIKRLKEFINHFNDKIYLSWSGGKDSTVLLDIIKNEGFDIPIVFCDTGLQYPSVKNFVKSKIKFPDEKKVIKDSYGYKQVYYIKDNVIIIRPNMNFLKVIEKYGYPFPSKEQAQYIYNYNNTQSKKMKSLRYYGNEKGGFKINKKWRFLINSPFEVSDKCCDVMKKRPFKRFEKKTGRKAIVATIADESLLRKQQWLKYGCNSFGSRSKSAPMSFWTEQDVLKYIYENNVELAEIYGEVKYISDYEEYLIEHDLEDVEGEIKEILKNMDKRCIEKEYKTTGVDRTGCVFCLFGIQNEKSPNRIEKLKESNPKLYDYCINDLKVGDFLDYVGVDY